VLESVIAQTGNIQSFRGETEIFIYPGFEFKLIDALVTNFHLPGSTLLLLVSAFSSQENILRAYHHAIDKQYRFFSYGDAMFISEGAA
jgi:S-adenosylmethionine:tRNA ribosyltransferase-isomerase